MNKMTKYRKEISEKLEMIYTRYHKTSFIKPDPLQIVLQYNGLKDVELVGLIASSLAIGRVKSILKIVTEVIQPLGKYPSKMVSSLNDKQIEDLYSKFKYRFYSGVDISDLIISIKRVQLSQGSLNNLFLQSLSTANNNFLKAQEIFVSELISDFKGTHSMLANPKLGSACKRFNLFLRWMVRNDAIDIGCWKGVSTSDLIIPLDTHIYQISKILGFTTRKSADIKTALEISNCLKKYDSKDPIRFDFSLSRLGIHPDLNYKELELIDNCIIKG